MRVETQSEHLFFTTVYITGRKLDQEWTGTGFIMRYETGIGYVDIMVTNKHVLEGADELGLRFVRAGQNGEVLLQSADVTLKNFGVGAWLGHHDEHVDVAVMFLGPALEQLAAQDETPFYSTFAPALLLTGPEAEDLDALENVTFVGYPNGLYDTESFLPIARRGQTATPIQLNYKGWPAFLIDASVFGGSSGSPVVLFDRGIYADRSGNATVGSRMILLGVLAAVHVRQSEGVILDRPTKQVAVFDEALNLGIVFKASTINECVDVLLGSIGIETIAPKEEAQMPTQLPSEVQSSPEE